MKSIRSKDLSKPKNSGDPSISPKNYFNLKKMIKNFSVATICQAECIF